MTHISFVSIISLLNKNFVKMFKVNNVGKVLYKLEIFVKYFSSDLPVFFR